MTHNIDLTYAEILTECKEQTSQDFRGARSIDSTKVENVNKSYEDFVIMDSDGDSIVKEVKHFLPILYSRIKDKCAKYTIATNKITFEIDHKDEDSATAQRIHDLLLMVCVYKVLRWWYVLRVANLSEYYNSLLENTLSELKDMLGVAFTTFRLRYY